MCIEESINYFLQKSIFLPLSWTAFVKLFPNKKAYASKKNIIGCWVDCFVVILFANYIVLLVKLQNDGC